jgi:DNA-binding response OmpR family regulator
LLHRRWAVCVRADLIEHVWWVDELFGMNRSLDVAVANIRKKLWKYCIETIPWVGYKLWIN